MANLGAQKEADRKTRMLGVWTRGLARNKNGTHSSDAQGTFSKSILCSTVRQVSTNFKDVKPHRLCFLTTGELSWKSTIKNDKAFPTPLVLAAPGFSLNHIASRQTRRLLSVHWAQAWAALWTRSQDCLREKTDLLPTDLSGGHLTQALPLRYQTVPFITYLT